MRNKGWLLIALLWTLPAVAQPISQATLEAANEAVAPAIVLLEYSSEVTNPRSGEIQKRSSTALGLLVSSDGLVMTHGHMVLQNTHPFNITALVGEGEDETKYDAEVLQKPDDINIVFLRLKSDTPLDLPYVRFTSKALSLGEEVAVYGVLSKSLDYTTGIWDGRIGAILETPRKTYCLDKQLRFGFINGPVVNGAGEVVGVSGFDLNPAEGGDLYVRHGHPLVYQTALFQKYIDSPPGVQAEEDTEEEKAWLGVFTQPLTDDLAAYWNLDQDGGLVVSTVVSNSPAEAAGLESGDVITNFDGTPIKAKLDRDVLSFSKLIQETGVGAAVKVVFLRAGEEQQRQVQLTARPRSAQDAEEYDAAPFGITVRELTQDIRIRLNLADDVQGVIVLRIRSGSPAQIARMQPGVIILGVGDYPVTSVAEFTAAMEKVAADQPKEVSLFARLGTQTGFFRLEPRWDAVNE